MRKIILILGLIILIVVGLSSLFLIKHDKPISRNYVSPKQTQAVKEPINATSSVIAPQITTSSAKTLQTATTSLKTYRNEEYGFEFQYPEGWAFFSNTFYSPFSKFNLVGASPDENGHPDPINSSILINIVTPDFANRDEISLKNLGANTSTVEVAGVKGKRYEYSFEDVPEVDIDLQIGRYVMILAANKKYEKTFNSVLSTFKFVK